MHYIIETKNYYGWIFGNEKSEYWTQVIYSRKTKFRNPIKQNWSHVFSLNELLIDYGKDIFIPIVVFTGNCQFQKMQTQSKVIYEKNLYDTIMSYQEVKITPKEVDKIYETILNYSSKDEEVKKEHVRDVKERIREKSLKEKMQICPRCNGELIERQGKYGSFWGCSNYPKCKYTKNIK